MLKSYLQKIYQVAKRGDAREESYYSALETLLDEYAESTGKKGIHITTLPKKTEAGNPDFRVWDGKQHITGYIEAKAPTIEDLDQIETTEQLKRYLETFPNVILTNFFEFRLYRNGNLIDKVLIGRPFIVHKLKTIPPVEKETDFFKLLEKFFSFSLPKVYDAKNLATELANRTRFLKDEVVAQELKEEERTTKGFILGFYEAFREYLISGLSKEEFADLYSQTITYGLFAARIRSQNGFNRKLAYDRIPRTIGILRDVFKFISLEDLPQQMEWIVDDISEVLAVTDVKNILHKYFHEGKGKDPIVHFYETFLAEYDPKTREKRGVYYTPEAVVSYIVRSLHCILKEHYNKADGFASDTVTVLDPAAGTLTFLAEAAKLAVDELVSKYGEGGKKNLIKEHILKNFYAFELMMAPYAVGHLKMSFLLEELGYKLQKDDRFKLYLTNTLEMEELAQTELPGMVSLSEESHLAGKVKKEQPILVILGNPPYSVSSMNMKVPFILKLIEDYKKGCGVEKEKRIAPIQDDYIKFIRWAHWKIMECKKGLIGYITNNSYLDGLIHRAMRKKLLDSFDVIYILNLHADAKIQERCPDGSKDENVFDIRQGVSISIFIKDNSKKAELAEIYYSDLWGTRDKKYSFLLSNDIQSIKWQKLRPQDVFYFFTPKDLSREVNYMKYISVKDVFKEFKLGFMTGNDSLVIDFDKNKLKRRMQDILGDKISEELVKVTYGLKERKNWGLEKIRRAKFDESKIVKCNYRPFDSRYIYYDNNVLERSLYSINQHLLKDNLAFLIGRAGHAVKSGIWNLLFVSNKISDLNLFYRGGTTVFPLYLYPDADKKDLLNHHKKTEKREPNISPKLFTALSEVYKKEPTPEEIFYYIYAVLYSNTYRSKYAEFLKIDFPRVPFAKDYKLFKKMAEFGERLVALHLMRYVGTIHESPLQKPIAKFQGKGDNRVEKLQYSEKQTRVYINKNQYFEGIAKEIWEYQIGGYQVCHKWLKDRKSKSLSLDDIKHYCKIATVLQKTIEIQKEIDDIYPEVEKGTIEFENNRK